MGLGLWRFASLLSPSSPSGGVFARLTPPPGQGLPAPRTLASSVGARWEIAGRGGWSSAPLLRIPRPALEGIRRLRYRTASVTVLPLRRIVLLG